MTVIGANTHRGLRLITIKILIGKFLPPVQPETQNLETILQPGLKRFQSNKQKRILARTCPQGNHEKKIGKPFFMSPACIVPNAHEGKGVGSGLITDDWLNLRLSWMPAQALEIRAVNRTVQIPGWASCKLAVGDFSVAEKLWRITMRRHIGCVKRLKSQRGSRSVSDLTTRQKIEATTITRQEAIAFLRTF
jgi:hypothetical protein